jgi:Ca2+-binding RTX toxin-like protein
MLITALSVAGQERSTPPLLRNPHAELRETCRGEAATDVVQAGEYFVGSSERDVIVVLGGAEVWANAGDDLICIYPSRPNRYGHGALIMTGPGNNTVITYGGSNTIVAEDGEDVILLNGDDESVEAGGGIDHVWALGAATAVISGEDGSDLIVGSPGEDFLDGGIGNDAILGAAGDDVIDGSDGTDTCFDTEAGTNFMDCEVFPPNQGLPEAGSL